MKAKKFLSVSIFILSIILSFNVYADEPAIHEVVIDAELSENGDIYITETWDVTVTSGTEWYLAFNNMNGMKIANLSVTDESGAPYNITDNWDINQSISQKTNKCGVIDKGASNYEICWGVGSYGRHQFTVAYTLTGFVRRYSDYAGFNHTFLSKGLSSPVDSAVVTIRYPGRKLDESTAEIWAFGYNGNINFSDNAIVADSNKGLTKTEGIIIMAQFENDYFALAQSTGGSFESVKNKALQGSDYNTEDSRTDPVIIIIIAAVIFICGFGIVYASLKFTLPDVYYKNRYGQSKNEMKANAPETRDIPFEGDFLKTFAILTQLGDMPSHISVISYYMLKWGREGVISETVEQKKRKDIIYINLNRSPSGRDIMEKNLYDMLLHASDNNRLTEKAIEQWSYKKYNEINEWYENYKNMATSALKKDSLLITADVKRAFVKGFVVVLNDMGWEYAKKVYGFKNYLAYIYYEDNNDISDDLLDDYLLYADAFGIYSQMENWYDDNDSGALRYYYMCSIFRSSYISGESHRSGGNGSGSASVGGGGGATGGGGGGSR